MMRIIDWLLPARPLLGSNPGMCPDQEANPRPLSPQAYALSTESNWLELIFFLKNHLRSWTPPFGRGLQSSFCLLIPSGRTFSCWSVGPTARTVSGCTTTDRVYYVSEKILKLVANISGDRLVSLGICFGKFTKTHKFRLHIIALDYLAPYAKYQVWIKPGAEQSFLHGNHLLKSGLGRNH
uniref:60S ribosome subunit biogenesis protein NIP7 pre-PUA domain-containing protein n=1 Tax=Myotis myotis TaxID=51298 RepID=A0A7J7R494_MYOMY|nr:hypothetical protein mMyoMyo1_010906 [Myotis myotis]